MDDPRERDRADLILRVAEMVARMDPDLARRLSAALRQAGGAEEFADWFDLLYRLERSDRDALRDRLRRLAGPTLRRAAEH